MAMKICVECKTEYPIDNFGIIRPKDTAESVNFHAGISDHYSSKCKPCHARVARKWRKKHPGYAASGKITKYPKEDRRLISAIRDRVTTAKQNNKRYPDRVFTINADDMYALFKKQKGKCKLTGAVLVIQKNTPLTLSIDKKIPEKGYVKGNVQWVCWAANRAKGDLSMKSFINLCKAVLRTCNDYPEKE